MSPMAHGKSAQSVPNRSEPVVKGSKARIVYAGAKRDGFADFCAATAAAIRPFSEKVSAARAICAGNTGLEIKALPPLSEHFACDSRSVKLVTKTTGVAALRLLFRISEQEVKPSIPGIRTSMKIRSYRFSDASLAAASPSSPQSGFLNFSCSAF